MNSLRRLSLLSCLLFPVLSSQLYAHKNLIANVEVYFNQKYQFTFELKTNIKAVFEILKLPTLTPESISNIPGMSEEERSKWISELKKVIKAEYTFMFDGTVVDVELEVPELLEQILKAGAEAKKIEITFLFSGKIPEHSRQFTVRTGKTFGMTKILIKKEGFENQGEFELLLEEEETSDPYPVDALSKPPTRSVVAKDFLIEGFIHIVPEGLDHILFVLGLFLLSIKFKPLLWQVSMFTIAHSITISLAMYKIVEAPASIVEPIIALSIAYVAIENIYSSELKWWRPLIVFLFGLLHGLGFASALSELHISPSRFPTTSG